MRRFCTALHYCTQSGLSNAQLSWNKLNDTKPLQTIQNKVQYKVYTAACSAIQQLKSGTISEALRGAGARFFSLCPQIHEFPTEKAPIHEIRTCYVCWLSLFQIFNQVCHVCQKGGRCPDETVPTSCIALYDSKFLQNVADLRSTTGVFVISPVNVVARFTLWQLQISDYSLIWNVSRQRKLNLER